MLNSVKTMIGAAGVALFMLVLNVGGASAAYPERPITMLVGLAAGGGTDIVARKIAAEMEKTLGQPIVVINRVGGGGLVSWKEVAAANPDGYTIAVFLGFNATIQKYLETSKAWIDPLKDVQLLGMVEFDAWGVVVKADSPFNNIQGFVDWVKANPGAKVSDAGPGTAYHWAWVKFMNHFGIQMKTVTYPGTSAGLKALAGGEIVAAGASVIEADSLVSAGLVKMLGVAAEGRLEAAPNIPTMKEQGFDLVWEPARGFVAPPGTPADIVKTLEAAVKNAYESDSFQKHLKSSSLQMQVGSSKRSGAYLSVKESEDYMRQLDSEFRSLIEKAGMLRK